MALFVILNYLAHLHNMDVKTINERITLLQNQRAQTISNVHALDGAIQDCKFWLEQISKPKTNDNIVKIVKDKK